jgi:hypothetical protein
MSMHSEDRDDHKVSSVAQLLMLVAIVASGVAITAAWFYLRW